MKVKNISARPHHVGDVLIAPGATEEIDDSWASAINKADLEEVKGTKTSAAKKADKTEEAA